MSDTRTPILCVDDERNVLDALRRQLYRDYDVHVASDAREGMRIFAQEGPFPLVISDLRMPVIDGISFLAKVGEREPDTIRILLTGCASIDNAADAVNRGQVYRFLTKPCQSDMLDQTFRGAIRALSEVLALASPISFSRAQRAQSTVAEFCRQLGLEERWEIEVACLLSQIGAVTLSNEVLSKMHAGLELTEDELESVEKLPALAIKLLEPIPRIESVIEILANLGQRFRPRMGEVADGPVGEEIPVGSRMLRLALDLDDLESKGKSGPHAVEILGGRKGRYDPALLEILAKIQADNEQIRDVRELDFDAVKVGMVLLEDVVTASGALLVARGQTITDGLILRLNSFQSSVGIQEPLVVTIPKKPGSATGSKGAKPSVSEQKEQVTAPEPVSTG